MSDLFAEKPKTASRIVTTYDYTDEAGQLLFQTVRLDPKDFRQRRPDGKSWIWNLNGTRRVLYRLPELLATTGNVYVVEGEKDADRLTSLGLAATTNPWAPGSGATSTTRAWNMSTGWWWSLTGTPPAGTTLPRSPIRSHEPGSKRSWSNPHQAKTFPIISTPGTASKISLRSTSTVRRWTVRGFPKQLILKP